MGNQAVPSLSRTEAEDFLYFEARLLDERRFDEWLALFTADGRYWVPCGEKGDTGPITHLVSDDHSGLEDRLWQLQHPRRHSQNPPSRTTHMISNVQVDAADGADLAVHSALLVHEVRKTQGGKGEARSFAGHCEHLLRRHEGQLRIASKTVWLIDRELPIYNLTFLL